MAKLHEVLIQNEKEGPSGFSEFLGKVFHQLEVEMLKTAKSFYDHSPAQFNETIKGVDKIFSSIERTWVGLFNNALIKADLDVTSLQEFAVWSSERQEGRCDLLFEWNNNHFIVEAKSAEFNPNWRLFIREDNFPFIIDQAKRYYTAEKDYYKKDTFLVALVFEWVRESNLQKANELIKKWKEVEISISAINTHFASFFQGDHRGALIYGKIETPSVTESN